MEGVAVKTTLTPAQMVVPGLVLMVTLGVTGFATVIVNTLLNTLLTERHVSLLVSSQLIVFPFTKVLSVYVLLLVPTFTPFFFH